MAEEGLNFSQTEEQNQEEGTQPDTIDPNDIYRNNSGNELGNFESEFRGSGSGVDDVGGDIINPMEEAEYYQGSFGDDNLFPEYKARGSDDEDDDTSKDVVVQELDDLPEDMKLRRDKDSKTATST